MQLRVFKYIVAVDENRNFGMAAKACYVSQPTLSIQIKKMEDYLGVRLFDRTGKMVVPTMVGVEIIALSKAILFLSDEIKDVSFRHIQGKKRVYLV